MSHYELRCRECGQSWGNQPRSICDDCFSPLEVAYDYDALKASISRGEHCPAAAEHVALLRTVAPAAGL